MDFLIQKERTGSPERFARKVELSRSTFSNISLICEMS